MKFRCLTTWAAVFAIGALAVLGPAQEPAAPAEADSALTLESVEAQLAAIEGDAGLDEAVKDSLETKYGEAIQSLKDAAESAAAEKTYSDAIQSAPVETESLQAETANLPPVESAAEIKFQGSIEELQKEVATSRAALAVLKNDLEQAEAELTRVKGRPLEISARLPVAQRELAENRAKLASPDLAPDPASPGRTADRLVLAAAIKAIEAELTMLAQEQLSQSFRENLLQAKSGLLTRKVENATAVLETLTALQNKRLALEARQVVTEAGASVQDLSGEGESVKALAAEVESLAREFESVVMRLEEASKEQSAVVDRITSLTRESEVIREQLDLGRIGGIMAQELFDLRQGLPAQSILRSQAKQRRETLGQTRLDALEIEEKARGQRALEESFAGESAPAAAALLATRREVLARLETQYAALVRALAAIDTSEGQYDEAVAAIRAFAENELFWVKSSPPISGKTLSGIPAAIRDLFGGEVWVEFGKAIAAAVAGAPVLCIAFGILLLGLLLARRRLGKALAHTGTQIRRISTDRYAHTFQALLYTVPLVLPIPLLLLGVSWALGQAADPSPWLRSAAHGIKWCAFLAAPLLCTAVICRPGGLGIAHFGWSQGTAARLRLAARWFGAVYIPLFLVMRVSFFSVEVGHFDTLGRVCFIVSQVWAAVVLWLLFRPTDGILAPTMKGRPASLVARFRFLWPALAIGCPLALLILTCLGFLFTAVMISLDLVLTAAIIAGIVVLYWLTLRWFMIRERKLALSEALAQRDARREATAASANAEAEAKPHETGEVVSIEAEEAALDLSSIGDQTRRLLRFLFGVAGVIAVALLWAKSAPLFSALDEVRPAGGLSLLGWAKALLIIIATVKAAQNLPGLLELAVLGNSRIQAGTRVAIVTLCQYALIAFGLALLFNELNVDWTKFGWIAAALSVGLGFGLQEVVANFVCGLILLFERPIRVGDVITVDGTTGTVTKIQMRATTIINWDRQELVVPNKTFITNTILNWTLGNAVNRILLTVGVAYGSDTAKARQILLEVAADHPLVLEDPVSMASFEEFADSSLTLRLRAYLPSVDGRIKTITELNAEIDRRFAEAEIEIAFPQRDLHVRSVAPGIIDESRGVEPGPDTE